MRVISYPHTGARPTCLHLTVTDLELHHNTVSGTHNNRVVLTPAKSVKLKTEYVSKFLFLWATPPFSVAALCFSVDELSNAADGVHVMAGCNLRVQVSKVA